ncbi:hypothetical protein DXG03_003337 [Asterophora parasitica]|uniref:Uncharacterized protein n=1 Tax=Asterophora parasitica TaxID=117018 RepID=A0A9P7G3Q4_9AGAR|nr:hypothetical protein DXG03_003337 [Asterophora parasitica]
MNDGDREGLHAVQHSDPRFIVATTLATIVIAGSAFVWRKRSLAGPSQDSRKALAVPDSEPTSSNNILEPETLNTAGSSSKGSTAGTAIVIHDELGEESEAKDKEAKVSRSKERRRRGKDPLKDLLKNAKKTKLLARPSRPGDSEDGETETLPKIDEVTRHSLGTPQAASSRSISSASNHRSPPPSQGKAGSYPSSQQGSLAGDGDEEDEYEVEDHEITPSAPSSSTPRPSKALNPPPPAAPSSISASSYPSVSPNIPLSSSSPISQSTSTLSSDSLNTPNTSPMLSLSGKITTSAHPEGSPHVPQSKSLVPSASAPPHVHTNPWDWDGAGPSPMPATYAAYRKPPRISKSRGSGSVSMLMSPVSTYGSLENYTSDLPSSSSPRVESSNDASAASNGTIPKTKSESIGSHEDLSLSFTFPSLNASANPSSAYSPVSPGPSRVGSDNHHFNGNGNGNGNVHGNSPRRAPTPAGRRPPTPLSSSTPPPSLSTQTQVASLRGALEAARLREEKMKGDIERYSKELEVMRWEGAAWRRRESELQTQVHQLMHRVQTYAALFASMSSQPSQQNHGSNANTNGSGTNSAAANVNGYHQPFSPAPSNPHSPPPHLQIPPTQILLGNGILSPMSLAPHSPFYPYGSHAPLHNHPNLSHNLAHMHVQHQHTQSQSPHQLPANNLASMMFGAAGPHSGSSPSSVAGSSSVGSHSPDLSVPGSIATQPPLAAPVDRRRRRTRTAGARIGGRGTWDGEGSDGSVHGEDDETEPGDEDDGGESYSDADDDDESVSEVLADAILKRPGSIRGFSKKGKFKEKELHTEFTFPSLSDFGKGLYGVGVHVPAEETQTQGDERDSAALGNGEGASTEELLVEVIEQPILNNEPGATSVEVQSEQEVPR